MKRILAVAALAGAGLAIAALPASAAVHSVSPIIKFSGHGDSGTGGNYWAKDEGQATITVTRTGPGAYKAHLVLEGSFKTIPGQLAPNQSFAGSRVTASRVVGASATIAGTADYSFTADRAPSGRTVTLTGDNPRLGTWEETVFPAGTTFGGAGITDYSLVYRLKCPMRTATQTWTENYPGSDGGQLRDGNITGC